MTERNEWQPSNGRLFSDDGCPTESVTASDLVEHCFWDGRAHAGDFLTQGILTIADELEVLAECLEANHQDREFRITFRAANRLQVLLAIVQRREEAAQAMHAGTALYIVPTDDEERPCFEDATVATTDELANLGYISRANAVEAIHVMCGGARTEVEQRDSQVIAKAEAAREAIP